MDKKILKSSLDRLVEKSTDMIEVTELIGAVLRVVIGKAINEAKLCPDCKTRLKESLKRMRSSSS